MNRGMVFSLDALLSVLITVSILFATFSLLGRSHLSKQTPVFDIGADILTVFEQNGGFEELIQTGNTENLTRSFDWLLPASTCGKIEVLNSSQASQYNLTLPCWTEPEVRGVVIRSFIVEQKPYFARMEVALNE